MHNSLQSSLGPKKLRFGLALIGKYNHSRFAWLASRAQDMGFDHFWYADEKFYRDVYVGLTVAALKTSRIKLGPFVTDPYSRHPAITAAAMASLDELSMGRAVLGLGAGGSGFREMGLLRQKPSVAIREAVELIRKLWRGEKVDYQGRVVRFNKGRLNFKARNEIPIYIGARGPLNLMLAGEVADGAFVSGYATPPGIKKAVSLIAKGSKKGGRKLSDLDLILECDCSVSADRAAARRAVKKMVALTLWSSWPDYSFLDPVGLSLPAEIEAIAKRRSYSGLRRIEGLLPGEFVDAFAMAGTPLEVAQKIARVTIECGISSFAVSLVQPQKIGFEEEIELFVNEVIPRATKLCAWGR